MGRILDWLNGVDNTSTETRSLALATVEVNDGPPVVLPSRNRASITVDSALTIPAVYSAIRILSTAVSQLEIGVWRSGVEIPTPLLVGQPEIDRSLSSFLKRTIISLSSTGNAYWRIFKDSKDQVVSVEILDPLQVSISRDKNNRKSYHYKNIVLSREEVSHLRLIEVPGHDLGLGPIQSARTSIRGALDLQDYSDNWFSDSGTPTGLLKTNLNLTREQSSQARADWHKTQAERGIAVLGQGLEFQPIVLKPSDAQFLETRQFSVTDIARLFGVPAAYMLAEVNGNSMTYQNLEQADTAFVRYTLMSYLKEIEDAFTSLLPRGQKAKFKIEGLLRPDAKTRSEIQKTYVDMGVLTPEEVRAIEGFN